MKIPKNRVESFSDGVISIICTIMVLNIPLPDKFDINSIMGLLNSILVFFVSFIVVGSQWNKQRHILDHIQEVTNKIIWWNLIFLFLLSLLPIFTKWIMDNPDQVIPAIGYDIVFLLVNICYQLLWNSIISANEELKKDIDKFKAESKFIWLRFSVMFLSIASIIILSIFYPRISLIFFIAFPVTLSLFNLIFENNRFYDRKIAKDKQKNSTSKLHRK